MLSELSGEAQKEELKIRIFWPTFLILNKNNFFESETFWKVLFQLQKKTVLISLVSISEENISNYLVSVANRLCSY
jgi:hypothetical protein